MPPITLSELVGLETQVWVGLVEGDSSVDDRLLADDFVGVYPSGFARKSDHVEQLDEGPTVADFELSEASLIPISDDAVMLCYRSTFRRPWALDDEPIEWLISSLWAHRDGRWLNTFSQDTVAAASDPA